MTKQERIENKREKIQVELNKIEKDYKRYNKILITDKTIKKYNLVVCPAFYVLNFGSVEFSNNAIVEFVKTIQPREKDENGNIIWDLAELKCKLNDIIDRQEDRAKKIKSLKREIEQIEFEMKKESDNFENEKSYREKLKDLFSLNYEKWTIEKKNQAIERWNLFTKQRDTWQKEYDEKLREHNEIERLGEKSQIKRLRNDIECLSVRLSDAVYKYETSELYWEEKAKGCWEMEYNQSINFLAYRLIKNDVSIDLSLVKLFRGVSWDIILFDEKNKNFVNCRGIYCAEDSLLVEPHWRFIITKTKKNEYENGTTK